MCLYMHVSSCQAEVMKARLTESLETSLSDKYESFVSAFMDEWAGQLGYVVLHGNFEFIILCGCTLRFTSRGSFRACSRLQSSTSSNHVHSPRDVKLNRDDLHNMGQQLLVCFLTIKVEHPLRSRALLLILGGSC